jgi:hypothetical protein
MSEWKPLPPIPEDEVTPQALAKPFDWNITAAAEVWTKDKMKLSAMSDPAIIDGLMREREIISIVGAAKTSKTWFALAMALAIALGLDFLGRQVSRRKVLYLDYELKPGTFRKRLSLLAGEKPEGFFFQCLRGSERLPSVDEIADLVEREGFGLVVIDSLYRTGWLSVENDNDATPRELRPLQAFTDRVPCSIAIVDHTAKGGGAERSAVDAARGASSKGGFYDGIYVLRPTDKTPDPDIRCCIMDVVLRDWPAPAELPLVGFSWEDNTAVVELAGAVPRGQADANATKVLEALAAAEKPIGLKEIKAQTKISDTTLRRVLEELTIGPNPMVVVSVDPKHRQRNVFRLADHLDEPRQTPPNRAA